MTGFQTQFVSDIAALLDAGGVLLRAEVTVEMPDGECVCLVAENAEAMDRRAMLAALPCEGRRQ